MSLLLNQPLWAPLKTCLSLQFLHLCPIEGSHLKNSQAIGLSRLHLSLTLSSVYLRCSGLDIYSKHKNVFNLNLHDYLISVNTLMAFD